MTIYELTEDERNVMRKLIENKLVVTIGVHADMKRQLAAEREYRTSLERMLKAAGIWEMA